MRVRPIPTISVVVGAALTAAGVLTVVSPNAFAYSGSGTGAFSGAPSWVQNDAARKGSVLLYDSTGAQITSGTDIQNVGVASSATGWLAVKNDDGSLTTGVGVGSGAFKVNASIVAPDPANANVSTWATNFITPTNYRFSPTPSSPAPPAAVSANPAFLHLDALGSAFQDVASGNVLYTGSNTDYKNILEIRIKDNVDSTHYWATDIEYNPTTASSSYDGLAAGAWKVVWPQAVVAVGTTTTTPTVTPSGASQPFGTSVKFTTTVAAASGSIASGGTVKFFDGATQIGATKNVAGPVGTTPVSVDSDSVTDLGVGSHTITAQFTPGGSGFSSSTSSPGLTYGVTGIATTATTPTSTPSTPVTAGTSVVFQTTVAAASGSIASGGTVKFFDGVTQIGATKNVTGPIGTTPVTVDSDATTSLSVSTHSITAEFTPGDAGFGTNASSAYSFVVNAAPADVTTTDLAASPVSTADSGTDVTLTATVADTSSEMHPSGTVNFKDGATLLGSATLAAASDANKSTAAFTIPKATLALGSHSFTAEYAHTGNVADSTSSTVSYTITLASPSNIGAPSTGAVRVGFASICQPGSWLNAGAFTYTWSQRTNASGAWTQFATTQSSGVIPAAYALHQVKCSVKAYSPAAISGTPAVDSGTATIALGVASKATKAPKITGTPKVGKRLSASVGVWSPKPTSYKYVWKVNGRTVSTSSTWTPSKGYKGKYVTLTVIAVRAGYLNGAATTGRVKIG